MTAIQIFVAALLGVVVILSVALIFIVRRLDS